MRIRDPDLFDPGSDGKIRIRDTHPGSATIFRIQNIERHTKKARIQLTRPATPGMDPQPGKEARATAPPHLPAAGRLLAEKKRRRRPANPAAEMRRQNAAAGGRAAAARKSVPGPAAAPATVWEAG
jgi:hypothetical protein